MNLIILVILAVIGVCMFFAVRYCVRNGVGCGECSKCSGGCGSSAGCSSSAGCGRADGCSACHILEMKDEFDKTQDRA